MTYLLDTHVWLWMAVAPERLGSRIADIIGDPGTRLLLSAASAWEISIKYGLGRLPLPASPSVYVPDRMRLLGVEALPVEHLHALHVASLPHHHGDPFDRLLIAQAQVDGLAVITADPLFDRYEVEVVRAR